MEGVLLKKRTKVISFLLSAILIIILIISGPANAILLNFSIKDEIVPLGDQISFSISTEIEPGEHVDVNKYQLSLQGPKNYTCEFDINGSFLSDCRGIKIERVKSPVYGYGYDNYSHGYGYGFFPGMLQFNVILDSTILKKGAYNSKITLYTINSQIVTSDKELQIVESLRGCSLRANSGEAFLDGVELAGRNNQLSLYVPKVKAAEGQGSLILKSAKTRAVYDFKITKSVTMIDGTYVFNTRGTLQIDRARNQTETAKVTYNKKQKEISIDGTKITVEDMKVNFVEC